MSKVMVLCFEDSSDELIHDILGLVGERHPDYVLMEPDLLLTFEGLEIRTAERRVLLDDTEIRLSRLEFYVLTYLSKHPGWVQTKRQIYDAVWPSESDAKIRVVETIISSLRKKIDPDLSQPRFIETVIGCGYRFVGKRL